MPPSAARTPRRPSHSAWERKVVRGDFSNWDRQLDRRAGRLLIPGKQQFGVLLDLIFGQVSDLDCHLLPSSSALPPFCCANQPSLLVLRSLCLSSQPRDTIRGKPLRRPQQCRHFARMLLDDIRQVGRHPAGSRQQLVDIAADDLSASWENTGNFGRSGPRGPIKASDTRTMSARYNANSLRIGAGNFLWPCRELNQVIRELRALIRES
jgi:hypothetical protein